MQTHAEQVKKARKEKLRAAQLAYLETVERERQLTPTEIARLFEGDPSTLTRFRNKAGYNGTLSARTIEMIEQATGILAPPEAHGRRGRAALAEQTPSVPPQGFAEHEGEPYTAPIGDPMAKLVTAAVAGRVHVAPWTLRTRALEDEGYFPGDVVIVDMNAQPEAGDIVCAQLYDFERPGQTRTVFRLFHPPFLVGASKEDNARVPQLIDGTVGIKGVVELAIRKPRRKGA
ncbi:MAG: hypothetical protein J0I54_17880 [Bosea sp.]|uniref:hypothetical protein n=1 Tax=unclassified Bosea (in: a-proteobacteria) TaxID=2653178 RepID=UPI00095E5B71|nr:MULTISPECIES: hypothetical protein [unclassified Bosea (in: a-proteobacteria)]MBN9458504.1 hypothetical protein [Bosea sp. (in: a-proteobacteria)]OJV06795.1 MAG: hypothetical protein BGO20_00070 [Bosea sp. 67-29]